MLPVLLSAKQGQHSHETPALVRAAAAALADDGQPLSLVAAKTGTSVRSVQRWKKRALSSGSVQDAPRSGRPLTTDSATDAQIVAAAEADPFAPNKRLRNDLALDVSEATIQRRLDAAGLPSCIAAQKRHYTAEERRKRLSFAHGYANWTPEQWERVIFSDEKTFEGAGRHRKQRVHRPPNSRFDRRYTTHTRIFAPSCHVFATFCCRGPGEVAIYEGKLDGPALKKLLDQALLKTAKQYYGNEEWWLVHDNSPPFKSNVVRTWLHNNGIQLLDWPPTSPDLNRERMATSREVDGCAAPT